MSVCVCVYVVACGYVYVHVYVCTSFVSVCVRLHEAFNSPATRPESSDQKRSGWRAQSSTATQRSTHLSAVRYGSILVTHHAAASLLLRQHVRHHGCGDADVALAESADHARNHKHREVMRQSPQHVGQGRSQLQIHNKYAWSA